MDYFKSPTGAKSLGLTDLILKSSINPLKKLSIKADYHFFKVQKPFLSQVDGKKSYILGSEIDTVTKYMIRKNLACELGIDIFLPSDDWQGSEGDMATFVYLILTARI